MFFQSLSVHVTERSKYGAIFLCVKRCNERLWGTMENKWLKHMSSAAPLIIMIAQIYDCILAVKYLPKKTILDFAKEGFNLCRVSHHSFFCLCLAFLCYDSKYSLRQLLHYASVYLRHHLSLFSICFLPSRSSHLFSPAASVAVHCPPASAPGRCTSLTWDKNKRLSGVAPALESGSWIR